MPPGRRVLVVVDDKTICESCHRTLVQLGYESDASFNPQEGLARAIYQDYAVVLLDAKMPGMDGLAFLRQLRDHKPELPVVFMAGASFLPHIDEAVRLGVSEYVFKPCESEHLSRAIEGALGQLGPAAGPSSAEQRGERLAGYLFYGCAWLRSEPDGSAITGALVPGLLRRTKQLTQVTLPRVGEVVFQGLPLAGLQFSEGVAPLVIPSPLTGIVVAVNEELKQKPELIASDPCEMGWIACVYGTHVSEEISRCRRRQVLLFATGNQLENLKRQLEKLGCVVDGAEQPEQVDWTQFSKEETVILVDAASFGETGPELVAKLNSAAPLMRVVVVAPAHGSWEAEYRKQRIFYYAVEPFADGEIVDILDAAFGGCAVCSKAVRAFRTSAAEAINGIDVLNTNGRRIYLMASPGLLRNNEGVGKFIRQKLAERMFPKVVITTEMPGDLGRLALRYDRLMLLGAKDMGRLPGSLVRDAQVELSLEEGKKVTVTTLDVQPDVIGGLDGLSEKMQEALAEHIVREMAAY